MITRFLQLLMMVIDGFTFTDYEFSIKMLSLSLGNGRSNVLCIPGAAMVQGLTCYILFVLN